MLSVWMTLCLIPMADPEMPPRVRGFEIDRQTGVSLAVRVEGGPLVHTGQVLPWGPEEVPTPPREQVQQVFSRLREVLQAANARVADIVKLNVYVSHPSVTALVEQELARRFANSVPPAVSWVQTPLSHPATMVAVDAIAISKRPNPAEVQYVVGDDDDQPALAAILPEGGAAYISGQAERGDGSLADATRKTMASLLRTLTFLNAAPDQVVQVKAFLHPMTDWAVALEEIRAAFPDQTCPPVTLVEWLSTLPIEIELVVATTVAPQPATQPPLPAIEFLTPPGMSASPVFCRVTRVNVPQRIYIGGLFGNDEPNTQKEALSLFADLRRLAVAAGSDLQHLAKATYYVSHEDANRWFSEVRPQHYHPERPPAASKAQVTGTGKPPRHLTLDMIAVPRPE